MNLRRAVKPFAIGFFKYTESWRRTSGSWCDVQPYGFLETSKNSKEEDKASKINRRFGPGSDSFSKFPTANVCPAIVIVSPEKGTGGSGVIIDSNGTILTNARNTIPPDFSGRVDVSLQGRRKYPGTILEVDEYHDLALLKIQADIPLPKTIFGSLGYYEERELFSIHRLLRRKTYPRTFIQYGVDEEGNFMMSDEDIRTAWHYRYFSLGDCGGPIVTLDGKLVGISTQVLLLKNIHNYGSIGTIKAMGIEEALSNVGYKRKKDPWDSWDC